MYVIAVGLEIKGFFFFGSNIKKIGFYNVRSTLFLFDRFFSKYVNDNQLRKGLWGKCFNLNHIVVLVFFLRKSSLFYSPNPQFS